MNKNHWKASSSKNSTDRNSWTENRAIHNERSSKFKEIRAHGGDWTELSSPSLKNSKQEQITAVSVSDYIHGSRWTNSLDINTAFRMNQKNGTWYSWRLRRKLPVVWLYILSEDVKIWSEYTHIPDMYPISSRLMSRWYGLLQKEGGMTGKKTVSAFGVRYPAETWTNFKTLDSDEWIDRSAKMLKMSLKPSAVKIFFKWAPVDESDQQERFKEVEWWLYRSVWNSQAKTFLLKKSKKVVL